jgi:hypothetical protein
MLMDYLCKNNRSHPSMLVIDRKCFKHGRASKEKVAARADVDGSNCRMNGKAGEGSGLLRGQMINSNSRDHVYLE